MPEEHAFVGASSAKQWMACPPSLYASRELPNESSEAAEEGTLAHAIAEHLLRIEMGGNDGADVAEFEDFMREVAEPSKHYSQAMMDYVSEYVVYVLEVFGERSHDHNNASVRIEQKLDTSRWIPDGFGTGDVVITTDVTVDVIDLKYGKGVEVSAVDNPQLFIYGAAALDSLGAKHHNEIETVHVHIVQPRLGNITTDSKTSDELLLWMFDEVKPKAVQAFNGEGDFKAGEHCQFCKAATVCRTRKEYLMQIESLGYADPALLTVEEIAEVLPRVAQIKSWVTKIQAFAEAKAIEGTKFPGYKVVEGRSKGRQFDDEDNVVLSLIFEGYDESQLYKPRAMKSLTAIESELGKRRFAEILGQHIVRLPGKPALVEESDKRPEWDRHESAMDAFEELGDEENG